MEFELFLKPLYILKSGSLELKKDLYHKGFYNNSGLIFSHLL